jgi:hypothetical protein
MRILNKRRSNMEIGKRQGIGIMFLGLILLTGGILVLVSVPSWGDWIARYPASISPGAFPPEAAPMVATIGGVFGPLLAQVGGYVQAAGYFVGSLLTLISLGATTTGITIIRSS